MSLKKFFGFSFLLLSVFALSETSVISDVAGSEFNGVLTSNLTQNSPLCRIMDNITECSDDTNLYYNSSSYTIIEGEVITYSKCKNVQINLTYNTGEVFFLNIPYNSDMLYNMTDIMLSNNECNGGVDVIPLTYDTVINATSAQIHAIATENMPLGTIISLYYGDPGASSLDNASAVWTNAHVAYYFNETSGTVIYDYSGNGNHGTLNTTGGVTMAATGMIGTALNLEPGSYVSIPNTDFKGDTEGGVILDINLETQRLYQDTFVSSYGSGSATDRLQIYPTGDDKTDASVFCAGDDWSRVSAADVYGTGYFAQLSMWVNSSGNFAYENTTIIPLVSGVAGTTSWFDDIGANQVTYINRLWYSGSFYSRGDFTIDNLIIYKSPPSAQYIASIFNNIYHHSSYVGFGSEINTTSGESSTTQNLLSIINNGNYTADYFIGDVVGVCSGNVETCSECKTYNDNLYDACGDCGTTYVNVTGDTMSGDLTLTGAHKVIVKDEAGSATQFYVSSSDTYILTPNIAGADLRITTQNTGDIIITSAGGDVYPGSANTTNLGTSSNYWKTVYAHDYYGKNTSIYAFDDYEDLELIKSIEQKITPDGRKYFEMPLEVYTNENITNTYTSKYENETLNITFTQEVKNLDLGKVIGLSYGAQKELIAKVEALEARIALLEKTCQVIP